MVVFGCWLTVCLTIDQGCSGSDLTAYDSEWPDTFVAPLSRSLLFPAAFFGQTAPAAPSFRILKIQTR